jgi:hypothetical protein
VVDFRPGSIDQSGNYQVPFKVLAPATVTVTATASDGSQVAASATINLLVVPCLWKSSAAFQLQVSAPVCTWRLCRPVPQVSGLSATNELLHLR